MHFAYQAVTIHWNLQMANTLWPAILVQFYCYTEIVLLKLYCHGSVGTTEIVLYREVPLYMYSWAIVLINMIKWNEFTWSWFAFGCTITLVHDDLNSSSFYLSSYIYYIYVGPGLLCSKFCLLCFWAVLKKFAHYAQYYAHESKEYAAINWHKNNLTLLLEYIL